MPLPTAPSGAHRSQRSQDYGRHYHHNAHSQYGVSLDGSRRDGVYSDMGPAEQPYMQIDGPDAEDATRAPAQRRGRTAGARNTSISGDTRADWSEAFALVPSRLA